MGTDTQINEKKIVLIVQCRISSTRLPGKALLPLGGMSVLEWNLNAMKKVLADDYYLATDEKSYAELKPVAEKCGFKIFAGSLEDVLDRFCRVIELSDADLVVRATADNPFLFYEAANDLVSLWKEKSASTKIDYLTLSGLPHGSGVEMFDARSLLDAAKKTSDPYDHEHVGPSLYNHPDDFVSVFENAPERYNYPNLRTTIDTGADYIRAQKIVDWGKSRGYCSPFTYQQTLEAFEESCIKNPVMLIPSVEKGHGTGHLHRCLNLATEKGWDIFIPENATLNQWESLVKSAYDRGLKPYQVVRKLDNLEQYSLAVTDMFIIDQEFAKSIAEKCPVCSLDEGAGDTGFAEYLLDIIPSVGLERKANLVESSFIPLPQNRRSESNAVSRIQKSIVVLGGEDPSSLSVPAALALAKNSINVTLVVSDEKSAKEIQGLVDVDLRNLIKIVPPVANLKETLFDYDLVVTHYGFTAYEASSAGCAVILMATTELHERLALEHGFVCVPRKKVSEKEFERLLQNPEKLLRKSIGSENLSLSQFITKISQGLALSCPICQDGHSVSNPVVARTPERTFRRCRHCGMLYQSWTVQSVQTEYNREYFYEDYEKQYGKTYEDDFASIKNQGARRISNVESVFKKGGAGTKGSVLDIGCALGPFLSAASDSGWETFGTDISIDAVNYVKEKLELKAICAPFPELDLAKEFGVDGFDAVTMWFVIEHFQNLDSVLKRVSSLVKKGGIFAFSTPSASGVSGKYNTQSFFCQSPSDHYSLWEPERVSSILRRYGFEVCKIVSTGIHPERFPLAKKKGLKSTDLGFKFLDKISRIKKLGDTFEVYCRKVR